MEMNGDIATLTVDSDHSNIMITNPEVVRAEKNREVVLHAISTKDEIRVISSASIDDQNKPDDFSFAAIVAGAQRRCYGRTASAAWSKSQCKDSGWNPGPYRRNAHGGPISDAGNGF
jgi:hypothetical protein